MNNKLLLTKLTESVFLADLPETIANFLTNSWKEGKLDQFFGQQDFLKNWREEGKAVKSKQDVFAKSEKYKHDKAGRKAMPGKGGQAIVIPKEGEPAKLTIHDLYGGTERVKELHAKYLKRVLANADEYPDKYVRDMKNDQGEPILDKDGNPKKELNNEAWKEIVKKYNSVARELTKRKIYEVTKDLIPPEIVTLQLTIPNNKVDNLIEFIVNKFAIGKDWKPGEGELEPAKSVTKMDPKTREFDDELIRKFLERMKQLPENKRANYLFNSMVFAKTPTGKGKPKVLPGERSPLKTLIPKGPKPRPVYKTGKPYVSKKRRGQ